MAWRPNQNLIEGVLDNTVPGEVTGSLVFFRISRKPLEVSLELVGDFHRDIAGYRIRLENPGSPQEPVHGRKCWDRSYMEGFCAHQLGAVGDMTAGWEVDGQISYVRYPYFEWYAENGRVVIENSTVTVLDGELRCVSAQEVRAHQERSRAAMERHLAELAEAVRRKNTRQ